jgi:hypothetical protein
MISDCTHLVLFNFGVLFFIIGIVGLEGQKSLNFMGIAMCLMVLTNMSY